MTTEPVPTEAGSPILEALIEASNDAIWAVDHERRLTTFNSRFESLCGLIYAVQPMRGMQLEEFASGEMLRSWEKLSARVLAGSVVSADDWILIDGARRYFSLSGAPVRSGARVEGGVFTARDLTDTRFRGSDAIQLTLSRFVSSDLPLRDVLRNVLEFICLSERWDAGIVWLLEQSQLTLAPEAMWFDETLPGDLEERTSELRFTYGQGLPGRAWRDAGVIWVPDLLDETESKRGEVARDSGLHCAVAVPLIEAGRLIGVMELFSRAVRPPGEQRKRATLQVGLALGHLIEQKRHEDERRDLQASIERKGFEWALTFDSLDQPIFLASRDGSILRLNRAARALASADYEDLVGRTLSSIGAIEPWKTLTDLVTSTADIEEGGIAQILVGEQIWDVSSVFYRGFDGEDRIIVTMRDITNVIRLQEAVRRGEQFAALGELVAGVAHEVKNPIFGMGVTVDTLETILPRQGETEELLTALRRWLGRLNDLMENLLEYGKTWSVELAAGRLEDAIAIALDTCGPVAAAHGVSVEADLRGPMPMLMDERRLVHVYENLITNAIQHSPRGGIVTVTANVSGNEIGSCVRDHGEGFAAADLSRVFQPFFTRRRGGTGLGLSIVQRIVEEHGGKVDAQNAENGGARVCVRFPLVPDIHSGDAE